MFDEFLSVSNRKDPLDKACNSCGEVGSIVSVMGTPTMADPVRMGHIKPSEGFRDLLRNIKARNPGSVLDIT
jgi:hypothetical protein